MIAYKIFTAEGCPPMNLIRSMFTDNGHAFYYKIGPKNTPKAGCGPLAAFDTLDHAVAYLEKNRYVGSPYIVRKVYEVEVELDDSGDETFHVACQPEISRVGIRSEDVPPGTIACKSVTIIKEVML